jgi:exopolyphosphatase/guanosine-5'-triphosphate,3'-diphosphate pyrophosphatase
MIQQGPPTTVPAEERRAAVEEFAKNCGVDLQHARQVSRLAGSLWMQLSGPLTLKSEDRELIESAALVANVGYLINFEGHHKHSYHLILNSELPGFERRELQLLAGVARYHRGSPPKQKHAEYMALAPEDKRRVSALAAILRLALALDRTHQQNVANVRTRVTPRRVQITVDSHGDFQKVFGRDVLFSAQDGPAQKQSPRRRTRRQLDRGTSADAAPTANAPESRGRRRR